MCQGRNLAPLSASQRSLKTPPKSPGLTLESSKKTEYCGPRDHMRTFLLRELHALSEVDGHSQPEIQRRRFIRMIRDILAGAIRATFARRGLETDTNPLLQALPPRVSQASGSAQTSAKEGYSSVAPAKAFFGFFSFSAVLCVSCAQVSNIRPRGTLRLFLV